MGCKSSKKEQMDNRIIKESCGLLNQTQLNNFYSSYNFTQNEMLTIVDEFKKICQNQNGLMSPENLLSFPPFLYSPFGYHILDALDLNVSPEKEALDGIEKKEENQLKLKQKNKKKKQIKIENDEDALTNGDLISDIPNNNANKENNSDEKLVNIEDFTYFLYLFSNHAKIDERAQLYFKLFDFDNDGKITPSDIIVYLENLNRDSKEVLEETKKYLTQKRKINPEDYISEVDKFKKDTNNRQIANLIIKESGSNGKSYLDIFDFRNMFLNMQFIPEYNNFLYLEEKFNDGRATASSFTNQNQQNPQNNQQNNINNKETEVILPVKSEEANLKKEENEENGKKESKKESEADKKKKESEGDKKKKESEADKKKKESEADKKKKE